MTENTEKQERTWAMLCHLTSLDSIHRHTFWAYSGSSGCMAD